MSSSSSSTSLIVKAVHAGSTRRLTINPNPASGFDYASFRARCAATFSLPLSGTKLSFTDDDGDEIDISSQSCLREAISFFSDEDISSNASSRSSSSRCVMRINVSVEYDGPQLSDYDPTLSDSETRWSKSQSQHRGQPRRRGSSSREERYTQPSWQSALSSGGDGKQELSQRWFAQLPQGFKGRRGSISSSLRQRPAHTIAPDSELLCSACNGLMQDLRYVCTACGPIHTEAALSDDGTQRDAPLRAASASAEEDDDERETSSSESSSEAGDAQSPATSLGTQPAKFGHELCSACVQFEGAAHAQSTTSPRHAFREIIRDDQGSWREIVFEDGVECSSCGEEVPAMDRYKCLTCARFDLCSECFSRPGNLHGGHCFQFSLDRPIISLNSSSLGPPAPLDQRVKLYRAIRSNSVSTASLLSRSSSLKSKSTARHADCMCFGCLKEVVGTRYHCSECQIDLCERCEGSDPAVIMPQSDHERSHILLKITVPVSDPGALHEAGERARHLDRSSRRGRSPGDERERWHQPPHHHRHHEFGLPPHMRGDFPPRPPFGEHHFGHGPAPFCPPWGPGPRHHRGPPPPPSVFLINAGSNSSPSASSTPLLPIPPASVCAECSNALLGERWLCASCPTVPPFELCSNCEKRAATQHDPAHIFVHLKKAPTRPPPPSYRLLPALYHEELLEDAEPVHQSVKCDGCSESIRGAWHHCGSCAESFDLCSRCYAQKGQGHDQQHAFVKFARAVDMAAFRSLSHVGSEEAVPLLSWP